MASRKKKWPTALRTVDMFSGKTALEEAILDEEEGRDCRPPPADRDIVAEAEEGAVRWLGLDAFHTGDDVKIAMKDGRAVILLVDTTTEGAAYGVRSFRLSKRQMSKLRTLLR